MKKIKLAIVLILLSLILCGCDGEALSTYVKTDLGSKLQARFKQNIDCAERLYNAGLITKESRDAVINNINTQAKNYYKVNSAGEFEEIVQVDESNGNYKSGEVVKSVSAYWLIDGAIASRSGMLYDDGTAVSSTDKAEKLHLRTIGNWYHEHYIIAKGLGNTLEWSGYNAHLKGFDSLDDGDGDNSLYIERNDTSVIPIKIVDDTMLDFDIDLDCTVYVLKSSLTTTDGQGALDEIVSLMQEASSYDETGKLRSELARNYFEPAKYKDSNETITLSDIFSLGGLVKVSEGYDNANIPSSVYGSGMRPGYDLIVMQDNWQGLKIRLQEFDYDRVQEVCSILGIDGKTGEATNKWVYGTSNDIYLMEYPVYYISGMDVESSADKEVTLRVKESDIGINLYTGKCLYYKHDDSGNIVQSYVVNAGSDPYLTLNGAKNNHDESKSAFILSGKTDVTVSLEINGNQSKVVESSAGRIILRDYLEVTYSKGVLEDTNLVVFGRKIRFNKIRADGNNLYISASEPVAVFVDQNGSEITGSSKLYAQDMCSLNGLRSDKIYRLPYNGEANGTKVFATDTSSSSANGLDTMVAYKLGYITEAFPSNLLGAGADEAKMKNTVTGGETKQLFYGIAVKSDMFETGLFSSWINSSNENASLSWWNNWLNEHGYIYSINFNNLEKTLYDNYSYELAQNGIVVLDLEVVAKIQSEMDAERVKTENKVIRTMFKVFGYILVCYGVLIIIAWAVDTNVDLGIGWLNILTLGKCKAIASKDEIDGLDNERYVTFAGAIRTSIVIIGTGLLLILADIFVIINTLIKVAGGLAKTVLSHK